MAVSNEKIMNKMMTELQQAKAAVHNQKEWMQHIGHIKLLSELLLDQHDNVDKRIVNSFEGIEEVAVQSLEPKETVDEGDSIFDF